MKRYKRTTYERWWEERDNPIYVARNQIFEPIPLADKEEYVKGLEMLLGRNIQADETQYGGDPKKYSDLQIEVAKSLKRLDDWVLGLLEKRPIRIPRKMLFPHHELEGFDVSVYGYPPSESREEFLEREKKKMGEDDPVYMMMKRDNERIKREIREYKEQNKNNPWWDSDNPLHYARHMMGQFTDFFDPRPMIKRSNSALLNMGVSLILGREVDGWEWHIDPDILKDSVRKAVQKLDKRLYNIGVEERGREERELTATAQNS